MHYEEIIKIFPRPCVDIMLVDEIGRVLLMLRANNPAQGQWWCPGGRIYFGETRFEAARRKLKEEVAVDATELTEIATFDLFFSINDIKYHDITNLFKMHLKSNCKIQTDLQAMEYGWFTKNECQELELHPYILNNV